MKKGPIKKAFSQFRKGPSVTITSNWGDFGTVTGDVTIQSTLQKMSTQEDTAEIAKVFAEMLKALQDSKEVENYQRRAVVAAAEDMAKEANKSPAQRDSGKLKTAWEFLAGSMGAVKGVGEIASHWGEWSEAIEGFFAAAGDRGATDGPP